MSICRNVLAVTKRPAELCAMQSLLHTAGLELVTATNMTAARSAIKGMGINAVIVCRHSWSDQEREAIISELNAFHPQLAVIMHCPGCIGCDEAAGKSGTLPNDQPLIELMAVAARP